MARTREFDEIAALRALGGVFWRHGYDGAKYSDLMAASGLGKGSLYAAFGDKPNLYLMALQAYIDEEMQRLGEILLAPDQSPGQRMAAVLDYAINARENGDDRGCFLCNAAVDQALHNPVVKGVVDDAFAKAIAAFEAAVGPADAGRCFLNYLGMRVMAKSGMPVKAMKQARTSALIGFAPAS